MVKIKCQFIMEQSRQHSSLPITERLKPAGNKRGRLVTLTGNILEKNSTGIVTRKKNSGNCRFIGVFVVAVLCLVIWNRQVEEDCTF